MGEDIFKTFSIRFGSREAFDKAEAMNNLASDISYSELILTYDNEFFRDRFAGHLANSDISNIEMVD